VSRLIWKDFHALVATLKIDNQLKYAVMWYYVMCNSFGGLGEAFGRSLNTKNSSHLSHVNDFRRYSLRLRGVLIESKDIFNLLDEFDGSDTEIYLDPPYVKGSCQSQNKYACDMDRSTHIRLIEKVQTMEARIIISSYDNELYNSFTWDEILKYTMKSNNIANNTNTVRTKQIEKAYIKYERFA
jgi:site-specific DNA-adenine methylase